ncbi:MAG: 30S ribosomal protein S5 [Nanoarchaeota archaeon]|nr:30S ribosomal protein S5 [Nanoarchaeota archaeon]MBU4086567.1 30S ribosomal protein S5 [Nanoarchaeota archaeon]
MKKAIVEKIVGKEVEEKSEAELERDRLVVQERRRVEDELARWQPKTKLGKLVKEKKLTDIDEILEKNKILEAGIADTLLNLKSDLLAIGQAKGKFGGGKRRVWRQTQKKSSEGNVPTFACMAVAGDENGHIGLGYGKAKETLPGRTKAIRDSKLKIMKIKRGCGSFDCSCGEEHSVPFRVEGSCGSLRVILMPAPQGTGLVVGDELKKILRLAGIRDVYGKTFGQTRSTINLAKACMNALKQTTEIIDFRDSGGKKKK